MKCKKPSCDNECETIDNEVHFLCCVCWLKTNDFKEDDCCSPCHQKLDSMPQPQYKPEHLYDQKCPTCSQTFKQHKARAGLIDPIDKEELRTWFKVLCRGCLTELEINYGHNAGHEDRIALAIDTDHECNEI